MNRHPSGRLRRLFGPPGITPVVAALLLAGCAAQQPAVEIPEDARVADLYIVDCLLPGQLRQLGNTTYMTPRRPVRTTAIDCRVRGGEYVAYDRADYKTALRIWLPAAEEGDADAQNTVGEIFEQGLGTDPNYEVAALWYQRAADQGHKTALFNLGTLYETGRGVAQDKVHALNLYRRAWGVSDDELVRQSDATRALLRQAEENARTLEAERRAADIAVEMAVEIAAAEAEARGRERGRAERVRPVAAEPADQSAGESGEASVAQADTQSTDPSADPSNNASNNASANPSANRPAERAGASAPVEVSAAGRNFGRYYALVIGNADYDLLDDLATPVSDAQRLADVLEQRYGFNARLLPNSDDAALLRALNSLNEELDENDNLLIYYSGHGNRRESGVYDTGYWLPINAEPAPNDTFWVPTEQVSGHLARLKARRIIVVADSSYAGLLADNPAFLLATDMANLQSDAYVDLRFPNRSRLLMTSGMDFPQQELGQDDQSVFADALIEVLEGNDSVLTAPALFLQVLEELEERRPELNPQFKAIKRAGDEVGDFFFVRQS